MSLDIQPAPTLAVAIGIRPDSLGPDAEALAEAILTYALSTPSAQAPSSRTVRHECLPSWSRRRYSAAMRELLDRGLYVVDASGGRLVAHLTVPSTPAVGGKLLASMPDELVVRLYCERDGWPVISDFRAELADAAGLGPAVQVTVDLGEVALVHPEVIASLRRAVASGSISAVRFKSCNRQVLEAWREALGR